ncbi:MAG TPA: hypothetical protein DDW50_01760 [Firmicutes bacterium]|jgi:hypothetical protein|nr:hypothetical protein [Bacillota bacterium]
MSIAHRIFRYVIYAVCLVISTSLIMYFLYHLSNNRIYHWGVPVGVIAVELLAQYFLSLGKSKIKAKRYLQGILLISIYVFYVLLFGVLSAIGFFAAEISSNISVTTKVQRIDNMAQKRYDQIDDLIASLNLQMTTEAKTGFGKNSQAVLGEIKRLKTEQSALMDQMNKESKQENTAAPVDAFSALAKMIGVNANILAIIIFGSLCLFVYTGLTVCNPNLSLDETNSNNETIETINPIVETKKFKLKRNDETKIKNLETDKLKNETVKRDNETKICPVCGETFPAKRKHHNDKCRLKEWRQSQNQKEGVSI